MTMKKLKKMNLNTIAFKNLLILNNIDNEKKFIDFKSKIVLEEKDKDDDFENITELSDITISFTIPNDTISLLYPG